MSDGQPLVPDYSGPCISNVVPTLLGQPQVWPEWFPAEANDAPRVLLLVLDGLGWEQLAERRHLAPTLSAMSGGPILTVAPSTTSTAMTSLTTGTTPGEHGVVGYRVAVDGAVLNVLRWSIDGRDMRASLPPEKFQAYAPFADQRVPAVTRADFQKSGFTDVHLEGVRFHGYDFGVGLKGVVLLFGLRINDFNVGPGYRQLTDPLDLFEWRLRLHVFQGWI